MIEVFYPDADGKIRFTKKQLEELLKRVYQQGHDDGYAIGSANHGYWSWTYPSYPSWYTTTSDTTTLNAKTTNNAVEFDNNTFKDNIYCVNNNKEISPYKDIKDTINNMKKYETLSDFANFFNGLLNFKEED